MEKNPEKTFKWIIGILNNHKIPFQVDGGLAARAYGAERELADIDLVIPEERYDEIIAEVELYIIYGPSHFTDDKWDLMLMTLDHEGQIIDIAGAENQKYFDESAHEWVHSPSELAKCEMRNVFGLDVPIIPKDKLIAYKTRLGREVDLLDLKFLNK